MLLQQTIGFQERRQTSNDIAQYPLGSQPTNHYAGPPSSSQPTDHHPEPPSSQPTDHHPEPSTSSCAADPLPGSPKAKQPTNDPMADVRDTPSPALRVSKRDRKSHIPLPTSSPTVQDDASDSWLGTPIAAQQATVNPPDDTFEIVDIGFFDRQRVIGAKVCWGNGTTKWLEVESIMDSAKDQVRCRVDSSKVLTLLIWDLAFYGYV